MAKKRRPPSRRDRETGEQRTDAIDDAIRDAPAPRRKALLRGVDRQPVIVREPKTDRKVPEGDQPALWPEVTDG